MSLVSPSKKSFRCESQTDINKALNDLLRLVKSHLKTESLFQKTNNTFDKTTLNGKQDERRSQVTDRIGSDKVHKQNFKFKEYRSPPLDVFDNSLLHLKIRFA